MFSILSMIDTLIKQVDGLMPLVGYIIRQSLMAALGIFYIFRKTKQKTLV